MTQPEDFSTEQVEIIALALEDRTKRLAKENRDLEAKLTEAREKAGHAEERRAEQYGNLQEVLKARTKARQEEHAQLKPVLG